MYAEENGTIRTRSPLMAFYLAHVRRLQLSTVASKPLIVLMGHIVYTRCWSFVIAA